MRFKALIVMLAMLLQPFAVTAAMLDMSEMTASAAVEHCADHSAKSQAGDSAGHKHGDAAGTAECLDECQACNSCAGSFSSDISERICDVPHVTFLNDAFAGLASQLVELLYRPPISS
jgi:hypothetical protein